MVKGLPADFDVEEIKADLKLKGFAGAQVRQFKSKRRPLPNFQVSLNRTTDNQNFLNTRELCHMVVTVEVLKLTRI